MLNAMSLCNDKSHPLEIIGRYRSALMGIAALWIVALHILAFKPSLIGYLLDFLRSIGFFGVDIFLFLSGFGLITGWVNKRYTLAAFYKRRLFKILPSYWVVLTGGLLLKILLRQDYRIGGFIAEIFCVGTLLDSYSNVRNSNFGLWFVDCIVIFYIAFPFIALLFQASNNYFRCTVIGIAASLLLSVTAGMHVKGLNCMVCRMPSFLAGMYVGYCLIKKDYRYLNMLTKKMHCFLLCCGLIAMFINWRLAKSFGLQIFFEKGF